MFILHVCIIVFRLWLAHYYMFIGAGELPSNPYGIHTTIHVIPRDTDHGLNSALPFAQVRP